MWLVVCRLVLSKLFEAVLMKLTLVFDIQFVRGQAASVASPMHYSYSFFLSRYLDTFESVSILARVSGDDKEALPASALSLGPSVSIDDLGSWGGALGYLGHRRLIRARVREAMAAGHAIVMIVPGGIASMAYKALAERRYPFALEVVGDPWDAFGPGASKHPARPLLRHYLTWSLRHQCEDSIGAVYVTKSALQGRYPCSGLCVGASDVLLPEEAIAPRHHARCEPPERIGSVGVITVGMMAQNYKGFDILIEALALCVNAGHEIVLTIVGDGAMRPHFQTLAHQAGMAGRIQFAGKVAAGEPVRDLLDRNDMFVLASRLEGLPRAMVEAMARGLPCIGTTVGGIPELLEADEMVPPGDATALAAKIMEVVRNPERMEAMGRRNLEKAREYSNSILVERRRKFYEHVRDCTREWEARESQL